MIKQRIMTSAAAADGSAWEDLVGCKGAPCMFDLLDYNAELVQSLSDIGVDGLIFIDGLDEIGIDQIKVLAMFNTKSIKEVRKAQVSEKRN